MTVGEELDEGRGRTRPGFGVSGAGGQFHATLGEADFDAFFTTSFRRVVAAVSPLVQDWAEAEDIAQEAFSAAARRWSLISTYEDPEGWVRRVAYNRAMSVLRSARRRARAVANAPVAAAPSGDDLETIMLFDALRQLPMKYRAVLTLHYLVDLPVKDVAEELGLPYLTVRSHLARGRKRLQELVADAEPSTGREVPGDD